ncbi:hypothetical protein [Mucilaginibacter gynuensis]|uniref:hypothetical protein n=1 Tax=Mucilaginibacter gynuensis TaxID=1302236 RepID=UPI0031E69739
MTTSNSTNKCSNCGGTLVLDALQSINKCKYCGSEFRQNESFEFSGSEFQPNESFVFKSVQITIDNNTEVQVDDTRRFFNPANVKPPSRVTVFRDFALKGLLFWVIYSIITRGFFPVIWGKHFEGDSSYFNNIFISKIGEELWFARGFICILIVPLVLSITQYPKILAKFNTNMEKIRQAQIDRFTSI